MPSSRELELFGAISTCFRNLKEKCSHLRNLSQWTISRAGHVPTFLKSFRSVLEQGPSDKSFRSCSFFVVSFRYVPFRAVRCRSVPFCSVLSRRTWSSRSVPFLAFLFKERFHPSRSVLSQRTFPSPVPFLV